MDDFHPPARDELRAARLREIVGPYGHEPDSQAIAAGVRQGLEALRQGLVQEVAHTHHRRIGHRPAARAAHQAARRSPPAGRDHARRGHSRVAAADRRGRARDAAAAGRALRPGRRVRRGHDPGPCPAPRARAARPRAVVRGVLLLRRARAGRNPTREPSSRRSPPWASRPTRRSTSATSSAPTSPAPRRPACAPSTSWGSTPPTCWSRAPRPSCRASASCRRSSTGSADSVGGAFRDPVDRRRGLGLGGRRPARSRRRPRPLSPDTAGCRQTRPRGAVSGGRWG